MPDQHDSAGGEIDDAATPGDRHGPVYRQPRIPDLISLFATMLGPRLPDLGKTIEPEMVNVFRMIKARLLDVGQVIESRLVTLRTTLVYIAFPGLASLDSALPRLLISEKLPPNWSFDTDLLNGIFRTDQVISATSIARGISVVQDEGIPLVWVPRADIVSEVLGAPNRDERVNVLLARWGDVIQDCRNALVTIHHCDLTNQLPFAAKVIDAFERGHTEAAQALAVVVVETVLSNKINDRYAKVRENVRIEKHDELTIARLRIGLALAAVGPFYESWYPNRGSPMPTNLSRHVTVHQVDPGHYTRGNAIVAVMLMTSVLSAIQEMLELGPFDEGRAQPR